MLYYMKPGPLILGCLPVPQVFVTRALISSANMIKSVQVLYAKIIFYYNFSFSKFIRGDFV